MPLAKKWTEALNVAGLCYPGNFGEHKRLLAVLEVFIYKTQMPSKSMTSIRGQIKVKKESFHQASLYLSYVSRTPLPTPNHKKMF